MTERFARSPLSGFRVVDLTSGPVGGMATMVLADFGAEVVKVERPGGDPLRELAAAPMWLRGKKSVVLDLRDDRQRARVHELCERADVVVTSFRPGRAEDFGLDHDTLARRNPRLVCCAISGWGPRGAYAGYPAWEGVVAAKSGRMTAFDGQRPRPGPGFAAVRVASHAAAQGAVHGIVAALLARERDGRGRRVETSLLQGFMLYDLLQLLVVQLPARRPERKDDVPVVIGGMPTLNYHPVMTKDGRWIQLANLLEHHFYAFLDATGLLGELLADERFQGPPEGWDEDAQEEARDRILLRMRERRADEWMAIFRAHGNVAADVWASAQQALDHPELIANGDLAVHVHPELGRVRQLGVLAELSGTPGVAGGPAPGVGADRVSWPPSAPSQRAAALPSQQAALPRGRPLDGVTVLELATIIAAPLGTTLLADLGARVIKVEPIGGDLYRALGPAGVMAAKTNAGKESICIDLKSEAGRGLLEELVRRCDALVHNYRPGVPERLGIGYEQTRALRPGIVWVAASGYGPHGPDARRPSAHPVPGAAMGGAEYQVGAGMPPDKCEGLPELREAARQLMRANEPNPDPNTSVVIASATLLALLAQRRNGAGQRVHVNMLVANAYANADDFLAYEGKPPRAPVDAELFGHSACYRLYPARTGWVFFAAPTDAEWSAFCRTAGCPEWASDPRFSTASARRERDRELCVRLSDLFASRGADAWESDLIAAGVGCVRADAATPGSFFAHDPHVRENGFAPSAAHARLGDLRRWGPLVSCDGGAEAYGPGVLAGEHTDALLAWIGRGPDDIRRLRASGIVGSEPR